MNGTTGSRFNYLKGSIGNSEVKSHEDARSPVIEEYLKEKKEVEVKFDKKGVKKEGSPKEKEEKGESKN